MYTGGYAINSTTAVTVRPELASFKQRRSCYTRDAADTSDCCSTGCYSSPAPAFLSRELSLSPAFLYSYYYYLRRRPAFLYRLPNPASCVTRVCSRWEVGCRERALLGLATRRASASCGRRLLSCRCVVGACRGRVPVCLCRGVLEDAGEELEAEEETEECYCGQDAVRICGYCNSISKENVAETGGYGRKTGREGISRHWDYEVTAGADDSAIRTKDHRKLNRRRTSAYGSASATSFSEDFESPHHSPSRDESTRQTRLQKSDAASERNQRITSLSEIKRRSTKQKDCYSKETIDSKFSSKVGSEFSSDLSSQVKQEHVHTDKKQADSERHSRKTSELHNATYQADYNHRNVIDVEVNDTNEASLVARLFEEVQRQSIEIEKLRESYQALESRSELKKSDGAEAVTRIETNEFNSSSVANLVEELKRQLIEINKLSKSYHELNSSIAYRDETELRSRSNKQSISNFNNREECATSAVNLVNEERKQQIRYDQSRMDQKKIAISSEIYETDRHRMFNSYEIYKTKLRDEEESSTSTIHITEEDKKQHKQKTVSQESFRKSTGASGISNFENQQSCSLDTTLIAQSDDKLQRMTSALHSMEEWSKHYTNQVQSEEDHQKHSELVKLPESHSKFGTTPTSLTSPRPKGKEVVSKFDRYTNKEGKCQEISTSQQIVDMDSRLGSSNGSDILGSEEIFLEANVLHETQGVTEGKASQPIHDLKNDRTETTNILETISGSGSSINAAYENVDLGSVSAQMHMEQTQQLDLINNNDSCDDRQDLLESARLFNTSSSSYIAEFVSELKKETSDTLELDISLGHSAVHIGELDKEENISRESEKVNTGLQQIVPAVFNESKSESYTEELQESKPLPQTAGPPDEMWDLSGSSQQACEKGKEKKEASEDVVDEISANINSGNVVAKRSGRSLWNLIADIIRISWASNAGKSQKSITQSGTRSSSNESAGSEVWFSGHEPEEDCNDPSKQRKKPSEEECDVSSRHQGTAYPFLTKEEESKKPHNKDVQKHTGSLAETSNTASATVGSSIMTGNLGLSADGIPGFSIPSVSGVHAPFASTNTVLSSIESGIEKLGINTVQETVVGSSEHDPVIGNPHENREPGGSDGDLRRRKLQRKKQVLRDTFDEWEEAHKLETEQRKKDEFFMKEALLEAKKAGDSWEVPVGAVLVRNGNIIARSGNMVEECRDSTAHAEIVCIREASNLLKTWRLSETTLYVTLEPCAMCAGAILQARIDTVVWGAPNKLLGADGSWVRLFPGGVEENTSLDKTDQTVGPIHPFHPKITIRRGVLGTECADVMQQFFQLRRKGKKQETPGPSHLPISKHPTRFFAKMHDMFSMMFCL